MEKEVFKEQCIKMFLEGKNYIEIAKLTNCSRQYISKLIKNDERVKEKLNKRTVKVYKLKNRSRANISIGLDFLNKIGIDKDSTKDDYVEVKLDEKNKSIIIKKK